MMWAALAMLWLGSPVEKAATIAHARELIEAGQVVEALHEIQECQKRAPDDAGLQFEIGDLLQELAASRAERLRTIAPSSPEAHELLGKSLESHQKLTEAAEEYKLARQANPAMPGINFLIGNLFYKQRQLNEARPPMEQELRLNPEHAFANLRMGQILLTTEADVPQTAIPYLRKAVADAHTGLEAHRELGKALRLAGSYQESLRELDWVARQSPNDESVHAQLAALYRVQGDTQRARRELEIQRELLRSKHDASLKAHQSLSRQP